MEKIIQYIKLTPRMQIFKRINELLSSLDTVEGKTGLHGNKYKNSINETKLRHMS